MNKFRKDFPALGQNVHGRPLVYLDSAASALKPQALIDTLTRHYALESSNVHRGVHRLSAEATCRYEESREVVRQHLGAAKSREIIFTKGTTEAINLLAQSWGRANLGKGDVIVLTQMEHHSNIVPWQMVARETGARIEVICVDEQGELDLATLDEMLNERVKMVSLCHASNTLGTLNPVKQIITKAHAVGARVTLDAAQSVPHMGIDVGRLGCDFLAFSGHKVYGPTGVGVLYGREELLEQMPPWQGGGAMIKKVSFGHTTYDELPGKFEAGTPPIASVIALQEALRYVQNIGFDEIAKQEARLLAKATTALTDIKGLRLVGQAREKIGVISFVMEGIHPHDIGMVLDRQGVALRTGHHCTQPLMERFGLTATVRASFALYNDESDIERLTDALCKARELLS